MQVVLFQVVAVVIHAMETSLLAVVLVQMQTHLLPQPWAAAAQVVNIKVFQGVLALQTIGEFLVVLQVLMATLVLTAEQVAVVEQTALAVMEFLAAVVGVLLPLLLMVVRV